MLRGTFAGEARAFPPPWVPPSLSRCRRVPLPMFPLVLGGRTLLRPCPGPPSPISHTPLPRSCLVNDLPRPPLVFAGAHPSPPLYPRPRVPWVPLRLLRPRSSLSNDSDGHCMAGNHGYLGTRDDDGAVTYPPRTTDAPPFLSLPSSTLRAAGCHVDMVEKLPTLAGPGPCHACHATGEGGPPEQDSRYIVPLHSGSVLPVTNYKMGREPSPRQHGGPLRLRCALCFRRLQTQISRK